jgi:uncharacterized protein
MTFGLTEGDLIGVTTFLMVIVLGLSVVPFVPGPILMWVLGLIFGYANGFARLTQPAFIVMTVILIAAVTSDFWLTPLGVKMQGGSCLSSIGGFVGGMIGTFLIPIPIVGTLIGALIGTLAVEFLRVRQWRDALRAGRASLVMFFVGMIFEVGFTALIFGVYILSLWSTGQ